MSKTVNSKALEYVYSKQKGYLSDLIKEIGKDNVKALTLTGFIKRGQELNKKNSWAATKELRTLMEIMEPDPKTSFLGKVQGFINHFFIDKKNLSTASL